MSVATGTYHHGRIELNEPVDWPEGVKVSVERADKGIGMNEAEWPDTPENRAEILRRIRTFEAVGFTPEDRTEITAAREWMKAHNIAAVERDMMGR